VEDFNIELAGIPLRIKCKYKENRDFFNGYFTDRTPEFIIEPTDAFIRSVHADFDHMNDTEGLARVGYKEEFLENNAIHILVADKLVEYNVLMLHGSALAMNGEGIIFTAKSGTGKSTHARLWREVFGAKVQMINDDKPMIRIDELKAYGTPWDGKHHLSSNTSVPVKAIVKIERAKVNKIEPISIKEAMSLLMKQTYVSRDPAKNVLILDLYTKLIEKVSFYRLECNMEPEAAKVAWEELIGPRNAFEYIDMLQSHNEKQTPSYENVMQFLEEKARAMNVPISGQFELTPLCNLHCKMCYVHLTPEGMGTQTLLSIEQWKDLIKQAFSAGMIEAVLTGGECLTYPGFDEIYLYLQSLGCQVTIMTNGVLLDKKRMDFFKAHPPALIKATLYGSNDDAYERVTGKRVFTKVLENLKNVITCGIRLDISITATSLLGEDIFETIRLARSLSSNITITTSLFAPKGEEWRLNECKPLNDEFIAHILKYNNELQGITLKEIPESFLPEPGGSTHECTECGLECGGGISCFVISWNGEMRICNRMDAKSFPLTDGFSESWKEINQIANNWPRVAECAGCAYENVCDTCAAQFAQYAEPGKRPETHCKQTKYLVSKGVLPKPGC